MQINGAWKQAMQTDLKNVYPYKLRLEDDHCGSFVHLVAITSQALIAILEVQIGLLNYFK